MSGKNDLTAAVIIIGNEVLSGRTQDANLQFLAEKLGEIGIPVAEARVVRDDADTIVSVVNECRSHHSYVFTTGGIGPTHDDITSASIARAFGVPLRRDPQAVKLLQQHYRQEELNESRLKMADVPAGAILLDNPVSRAPGFQLDNVFVLPGVPMIMRAMFESLQPKLRGGAKVLSRTISAFTTEGAIAAPLAEIQLRHGNVEIGSYPFIRAKRFGVSLVVRSTAVDAIDGAAADIISMLQNLAVEPIEDRNASAA